MAVLKNPRHERFCQAIVIGKSHRMAYIDAGYKSTLDSADASAARLLADAKVAARVSELQVEAAKQTSASAARVLEEMARLAFANLADFFDVDTNGAPRFVDWGSLSRDKKAALQEVTVDVFTNGRGDDAGEVRRVKFKLADKRATLVDLGRHLGLFKEKMEHSGPGGGPILTKDVSDLEAARRVAFLLRKALEESRETKP